MYYNILKSNETPDWYKNNLMTETNFIGGKFKNSHTGKSLSKSLIFASTNPHYDDRLFINYKFNTWKFQAQT